MYAMRISFPYSHLLIGISTAASIGSFHPLSSSTSGGIFAAASKLEEEETVSFWEETVLVVDPNNGSEGIRGITRTGTYWDHPPGSSDAGVDGIVRSGNLFDRRALSSGNNRGKRDDHIANNAGGQPQFNPSRVMVQFENNGDENKPSFLPGSGRSVALGGGGAGGGGLYLTTLPPGLSVSSAIKKYNEMPNVRFVEPDYEVHLVAEPNDPMYAAGMQWDMTMVGAEGAWGEVTDCTSVQVAVIDTGIDFTQLDLAGNRYTGLPEGPNIGGYNCIGTGTTNECVPQTANDAIIDDDHGHGTHCAGTIGAMGNEFSGMTGLCWSASLIAFKFLSSSGSGYISDAVVAFKKIKELNDAGHNIRVTSNSWGGGGYSQAFKDAIDAVGPNTVNVFAAGNTYADADVSPHYPGSYDSLNSITVSATDEFDVSAYFTTYGISSVDIAAPGVSTISTVPTGSCNLCNVTGYKYLSGTSMACPHVAGAMAMLFTKYPALDAIQARDLLLHPDSYDKLGENEKAGMTSTGGRLNITKAFSNGYDPVKFPNHPPVVTMTPDALEVDKGDEVVFSETMHDPDGDEMRAIRTAGQLKWLWLFGYQFNQLIPSTLPFLAPSIARTAMAPFATAASDYRGGAASASSMAIFRPDSQIVDPGGPTGTLTVPSRVNVSEIFYVNFDKDDTGRSWYWDIHIARKGGASGSCCTAGTLRSVLISSEGTYIIHARAIDSKLRLGPRYSAVVVAGNVTADKPVIARATMSPLSGKAPLSVNVDASASDDGGDGLGLASTPYCYMCGTGYCSFTALATHTCTFDTAGTYHIKVYVRDIEGYSMQADEYVVVTPGDPPAPTTSAPTGSPTKKPTGIPTNSPSKRPTGIPTTKRPTNLPTQCFIAGNNVPGGCSDNTNCCANAGCSGGNPDKRTCLSGCHLIGNQVSCTATTGCVWSNQKGGQCVDAR